MRRRRTASFDVGEYSKTITSKLHNVILALFCRETQAHLSCRTVGRCHDDQDSLRGCRRLSPWTCICISSLLTIPRAECCERASYLRTPFLSGARERNECQRFTLLEWFQSDCRCTALRERHLGDWNRLPASPSHVQGAVKRSKALGPRSGPRAGVGTATHGQPESADVRTGPRGAPSPQPCGWSQSEVLPDGGGASGGGAAGAVPGAVPGAGVFGRCVLVDR